MVHPMVLTQLASLSFLHMDTIPAGQHWSLMHAFMRDGRPLVLGRGLPSPSAHLVIYPYYVL